MSVNKVILVGNVGRDPEVKYLDQDTPYARFTLATSETFTKNGERVKSTEWHNIVLWRGLAKVAEQYVKKGAKLYIEGKITHRQYEQDGVTKSITEVVGNNMVMLDSKPYSESKADTQHQFNDGGNVSKSVSETPAEFEVEDDLPF